MVPARMAATGYTPETPLGAMTATPQAFSSVAIHKTLTKIILRPVTSRSVTRYTQPPGATLVSQNNGGTHHTVGPLQPKACSLQRDARTSKFLRLGRSTLDNESWVLVSAAGLPPSSTDDPPRFGSMSERNWYHSNSAFDSFLSKAPERTVPVLDASVTRDGLCILLI
jgi:hypothetical protein